MPALARETLAQALKLTHSMFFKVPGTRYFLISKIEGEVVSLKVEIIGQIASGLSTDCYLGLLPGRSYLCFNIIFKCGYETEILFKIKLIIGGGKTNLWA